MRAIVTIIAVATLLAPRVLSSEGTLEEPYIQTPPIEEAQEYKEDTSNAICTDDCPLVEIGQSPWK